MSFFTNIMKNDDFPLFFYSFQYKNTVKQKREPLDVKPNFPSLETYRISLSHSIHSSAKRASESFLFDIKVTRYRTYVSDRLMFMSGGGADCIW